MNAFDLPLHELKANGVDTDQLVKLLVLIDAPPDCKGFSNAIWQLQYSATAISGLSSSSTPLSDLVSLIHAACKYSPLPLSSRFGEDDNPMLGRYEDYPAYSLFTQVGIANEKPIFARGFNLISGLLLATIWISNTPWQSTPPAYAELAVKLRNIRRIKKSEKLFSIADKAKSLQNLIDLLTKEGNQNNLISVVRKLAIELQESLSKYIPQKLNNSNTPAIPPSKKNSAKKPKQPVLDFGDGDEWVLRKMRRTRPVVTQRPPALQPNTLVLRKSPAHLPGIDTSEDNVTASVIEAPSTSYLDEPSNLGSQKFQVLDSRYANEMDNQLLPYAWEILNEHEVSFVISAIKASLSNESESTHNRIGALVAGISLVTSRRPAELASFNFQRIYSSELFIVPTILLDKDCWFSPFPPLERFEPNTEQSSWLRPVGNGCFLPLPVELLSALTELSSEGGTLGEALRCSADDFDNLTNEFCRKVRMDARSRANTSWLRSIMFYQLLAKSNDDVGSLATLGNTEHAPGIGLYYATFEQAKWQKIYSLAISSLALSPSVVKITDSHPYGSRQNPDYAKLNQWIDSFAQSTLSRCKQVRSVADIIESHNQFASYTFLMLMAITGHRPSEKYTFSPLSLDLENGWAVISDKITSPSTRVRIIPLPDLTVKQLINYKSHLRNLSARLYPENPTLACTISMLVDVPSHALLDLFFWLDEDLDTTAIDMPSFSLKYNWPFEGNAFRHFLSTGLRNEGISAEHIAILLAHVETGQFGFGKFSALSPEKWKKLICTALDHLLESQGWVIIAGITHLRKTICVDDSYHTRLERLPEIDLFTRARNHVAESHQDRMVVRSAFRIVKANMSPSLPKDQFLTAFREEIIRQSQDAPDRVGKRLNMHVRFVRLHRHALKPSSIPGWVSDMHVEDTPLVPESLVFSSCANHCRNSILVISQHFAEMNQHDRLALIMVSAVLYGGLLRESLVTQLPKRLFGGMKRFDEYFWIDFDDPQSGGCQRWFPDPVTAILIARHISEMTIDLPKHENHLRFSISNLLKMMVENLPNHIVKINSLDDLIRIAKAFFTLRLPGLVRAYACGDVRSASLSEGAWLRLISGRPLCVEHTEVPTHRNSMRPSTHTSQDIGTALDIYSKLCFIIRDELDASNAGATNRVGERKNHLSALSNNLDQLLQNHGNIPSIATAIISWTNHLAVKGSVIVRKPAIGTIYGYVTDISRALIEFSAEVNFFELNEADLTDIYQRVIDFGSNKTRRSRATSLRWFHEFCEDEYDLPEMDWNEIAPGLTTDKSNVSANLITFNEYSLAKCLIRKHPLLQKRARQMHEVALILLYRCGLRFGELLRLTVSDAILSIKHVLLIRNGIYGKTKSRAGVRQIPWLDRIDDDELGVINEWIDHRKAIIKDDPWGALFGETEEARTLEVRLYITRILVDALRFVTGDPTVKIHHLRHGAGTSAISIALFVGVKDKLVENAANWFENCSPDLSSEFREFHLGQSTPTRRIVYAISQALGHTSPRTTCWHYGHALDLCLLNHVSQQISLKNVQVATLSGINQNLLNVTAHNNREKTPAALALNWLLKNVSGMNPQCQLALHPVDTSTYTFATPIHGLPSLTLAHVILTDISHQFHVAQIANRYAREEAEIEALREAAKTIERKTGYLHFSLTTTSDRRLNINSFIEMHAHANKYLKGHAAKLIPIFKQAIDNPKNIKKIENGLRVWAECYNASHPGLLIPFSEDIKIVTEMLELFGIRKEQFAFASNSMDRLLEDVTNSKITPSPRNLIQRSSNYRSKKRTPIGTTHASTLLISTSPSGLSDIAYQSAGGASVQMTKIHHLLFLCSVIIDCQKRMEELRLTST